MLLAVAAGAQASEWVSIGKTADGKTEYFGDVSSIQSSGIITRAWTKSVFAPHTQKFPPVDSKKKKEKKWAMYTVQRIAYMCAEGNSALEAMSVYFEDGTYSAAPADAIAIVGGAFEPVAPDTVADTLMKFVCNWKPTAQTGEPPSQSGEPHSSDVDRPTPVMTIQIPDCREDYYPSQASRLNQHGSAVVKVCIGVNNKIDGPIELLTTSGFPSLDEAAGKCMSAGRFKAGTVDGKPVHSCKDYKVTF
jgi:outer membrane biosynthesis protein TonB